MFLQKLKAFCLILEMNSQILALVELPQVEDNILATTSVIGNVTNNLFSELKDVQEKSRLQLYSSVHNYPTLVTFPNFKDIEKIARVNKKKLNNATRYSNAMNEDLRGDQTEVKSNNENVLKHIELLINKLRSYKANHDVHISNFDINDEVFKNFDNLDAFNYTQENKDSVETSDNESEFWTGSKLGGRRIYKGTKTKIKYFPFMASILIFNEFQCGGAIISSDLVITAASCLQLAYNNRFFRENPAFLSVRVGSTYFNGGGEVIAVLEVYFYPGYNPKTLRNNICILRLIRHIKFRRKQRKIKKIRLDRHETGLSVMTDGITVLGWGAKQTNNMIHDPRLSYAVLDIYHLGECQDVYSRQYVTKKNFCAGFVSIGGGACNRDVGGPGVVDGILTGIISFGTPKCGTTDAPTVFTKVGFYTDWIEEIMEQKVPVSKKRITQKSSYINYSPIFQTEPAKTTFKLEPLNGTLQLKPSSKEDSLQTLSDSTFNEFIKTIFNTDEIEKYKSLLEGYVEKPKKHELIKPNDTREATEATYKATEMGSTDVDEYIMSNNMSIEPEYSIEREDLTIEIDEPVTEVVVEKSDDLEKITKTDIGKLIDITDTESFIQKSAKVGNDTFLDNVKNNEEVVHANTTQKLSKDVNDSGLTSLYFSDNENKGDVGIAGTADDIEKDTSVVKTPFKDSIRNDSKYLQENALMNLLLEAFEAEFGN